MAISSRLFLNRRSVLELSKIQNNDLTTDRISVARVLEGLSDRLRLKTCVIGINHYLTF